MSEDEISRESELGSVISESSLDRSVSGLVQSNSVPSDTGLSEATLEESIEESISSEATAIVPFDDASVAIEPDYVDKDFFKERYSAERGFRKAVHQFMDLSLFSRLSLTVVRFASKLSIGTYTPGQSWYSRQTEALIDVYAKAVEDKIKAEKELAILEAEFKEIELDFEETDQAYDLVQKQSNQAEKTLRMTKEEEAALLAKAARNEQERKKQAEQVRIQKIKKVSEKLNSKKIVEKKIKSKIASLNIVKVDEATGELEFDDDNCMAALEDKIFEDIVGDISQNREVGFEARLTANYGGAITHFETIRSAEQLDDVDWVQSLEEAASNGRIIPAFDDLIVPGYGESEIIGNIKMRFAMALDGSGSMIFYNRWKMAKRVALASLALMRRQNKGEYGSLGWFGDELKEITARELKDLPCPRQSTRTYLGLDWILTKLQGAEPAIGYMLTDGHPWSRDPGEKKELEYAIESATKYRDHPNILLRIFAIDCDDVAIDKIQKIGEAAGPNTKVMSIKSKNMESDVIMDYADVFTQFQSIAYFGSGALEAK